MAEPDATDWIDHDAGLVLALRISQLQQMNELVLAAAPEARGSISLATLGAAAVLGWNPFQDSAWQDKGFAIDENLVLQIEAIDAANARKADMGMGSAFWRTRLVLPTEDATKAKQALSNIGFREKVNLGDKGEEDLASLLGISIKDAKIRKTKLRKAGVFLIARPTIVPGILLVAQHRDLIVINLLRPYAPSSASGPWKPSRGVLAIAAARRESGIAHLPELHSALTKAKIGLILSPQRIADALLVTELDGQARGARSRKDPKCEPFVTLAGNGDFWALSLQAEVRAKSVRAELQWHLRSESTLLSRLSTHSTPVWADNGQALHALVRLNQIGQLRNAKRSPVTQSWDALWAQADLCHPATSTFAWAIDAPNILGLFLQEVAALHPQAETMVDSMGPMVLSSHGEKQDQQLVAEAWIRTPGVEIAKTWLRALFGHETRSKKSVSWGQGPMRPYALARKGGWVFGTNLVDPGQTSPKHAGMPSAPRGGDGDALFRLRAKPSLLRAGLVRHPQAGLLAAWQRLSADLTIDKDQLRFTIDLQKD